MTEIKTYIKKPVAIEAIEFDGTQKNRDEIEKWLGREDWANSNWFFDGSRYESFIIETLEGYMFASVGDYIIRGIAGEFYPCKPDIFKATYEAIGE